MQKTIVFFLKWSALGVLLAGLLLVYQGPRSWRNFVDAVIGSAGGQASYTAAVKVAAPAVVSIRTVTAAPAQSNPLLDDPLFRDFFNVPPASPNNVETGVGSGVIVGPNTIVTNHHVIDGAQQILIVLHDGRRGIGNVLGSDPDTDLAVLRTELALPRAIRFTNEQQVNVGDIVLAIGNPLGIGQTVTQGIVSATGRDRIGINTFENFVQTDAAINPGNSGGALVNAKGELVGVNAAILAYQGIGFAIPGSMVKQVLTQLLKHGEVARGWLGIDARDLSSALGERFGINAEHGIIVLSVMPQGPAAQAGILTGDVITQIDGEIISDSRDALKRISELSPMQETTLTIERRNQTLETKVMVQNRPRFQHRVRH